MRPDTSQNQSAPFVAKAFFNPEALWYGKYGKFYFASTKYAKNKMSEASHFQELKDYVDRSVINTCRELVIFDNRQNRVYNGEKVPVQNRIVYEVVNGQVINDTFTRLSFMDWTFNAVYLHKLARTFTTFAADEREELREKLHFETWRHTIDVYKRTETVINLLQNS